jgi:O-antigen ligase
VLLGAALFPGAAFNDEGRLQGSIWPIPPPQVGHYAAMLLGCTVVLWFTGSMRGRTTVVTLVAALAALLLSHTRTALAGMVIGIALAAAGLFLGHARVRRTVVTVGVVGGLVAVTAGPALLTWLSRGQTAQEASQLTGRTKVWTAVGQAPRTWVQELFGTGLSNKSFNGLPIDSNWVATYVELGYAVVLLQVILLTVLLVAAIAHPRGPRRAVALFIVGYCIVASFTETGLGDASPYLLELVVVGSLLVRPTPSDDARTRSG